MRRRRAALPAGLAGLAGLFLALALCLAGSAGAAETGLQLKIYGSGMAPTSYLDGDRVDGFAVRLARLIVERMGAQASFHIAPGARLFMLAESEPNVVLIGVARTPERERTLKFSASIFTTTGGIYAVKAQAARLRLAGAGPGVRVGARRGSVFNELARRKGYVVSDQTSSPENGVAMLMLNRFDLLLENSEVMDGALKKAGYGPEAVERIVDLGQLAAYFAFSAGTSDATVRAWDEALSELKKDGSVQRMREQWRAFRPGGVPPPH